MNTPSEEQQIIIEHYQQGKHVIVDACAGSGKSTTILSCALYVPEKKCIQITFNTQLCAEVKAKITELDLKNINVYTFHGLAVKYYYAEAHEDSGIRKILRENMVPKIDLPEIDVLFMDECQDMTFLYFHFMIKFIMDMGKPLQIMVLGDKKQGLYEFRGSHIGFLTDAQKIWENHPYIKSREFVHCTLRMSYRITCPMSDFINEVMLGETRLIACKPGSPVKYIRRPIHVLVRIIIAQINLLITENEDCSFGDFFILAPSVKKKEIKMIENELVQVNIPCYIPNTENQDKLDSRVIDRKVVISTFHSSKGRQRKYVFVMGFDNTYTKYFDREADPLICPNPLYVATSRGTDALFLLENEQSYNRPLPFLKMTHLEMKTKPYLEFIGHPMTMAPVPNKSETHETVRYVTPTSLIQFIPEHVLDIVTPILDRIFVQDHELASAYDWKELDIPSTIQTQQGYCEDVSDINGNALPIMFYDYLSNSASEVSNTILPQMVIEHAKRFKPKEHSYLKKHIETMPQSCESVSDYLYLSNLFAAIDEQLYSRLKQIDSNEYTWLKEETIQECFQRLDIIVGEECKLGDWVPEKTIIHSSADEDHSEIDACLSEHLGKQHIYRFTARLDLITQNTCWEWKCTSKVTTEHMLQVTIYAWLWTMLYPNDNKNFRLFNLKKGELWKLNATKSELTEIVVELLRGKYKKTCKKTDAEFIADANKLFDSTDEPVVI